MGTRDAGELIASPPAGERPAEWAFRPDIEGLRAVAILLVVLYHAAIGPFAGGFVGVDVFYVLSGFLITGILLREFRTTGRISLPAFYARRARRLLPAAALVLLVTLVASTFILPPLLVPGVATDAAAAALYVANIRFAMQATDYFAAGQAPSPLLHYWSLGVEEQFYLLWPAIVLLVAHRASRPTWRVGSAALLIAALSLGLSVWLTSADAPLAFYLLPARAWELGLGALLAIAGTGLRRVPGWAAAMGGWAGLGLIALAGIVVNDATPYPGLAALLPTVGAALVVASGARPTALAPAQLLGQALPRYLGRISYSLYLWHWPLLVLPALAVGTPLPLGERAGLVVVAVLLAALTQRFLEDPIRRGRLVGVVPRRNLAMAGGLALGVALIAVGSGVVASARLPGGGERGSNPVANAQALERALNNLASQSPRAAGGGAPSAVTPAADVSPSGAPLPSAPAPAAPTAPPSTAPYLPATLDRPVPAGLQPSLAAASQDYPESYLDRCHVEEGGHASRGTCLYGNLTSTTTIALFGDSHALSWFPAVEGFAEHEGWRLLSLTMSACTPADVEVYNSTLKRIYTECTAWRQQAMARLVATRPAVILVTGTHGIAPVDASGHLLTGQALTQAWEAGMARTLEQLIPAAGLVILLADTPASTVDPPVCLSAHPDSILACSTPVGEAIDETWLAAERQVVAQIGVGFIDPTYWVCPSSPCPPIIGNLLVYRDGGHLTATFATALADRLGQAVLQQVQAHAGLSTPESP